ncbi:MAG: flagellar motor switch protein FliG [Alphaproteobacteria bacterium]
MSDAGTRRLTRQQKAVVIIGVLGSEAAGRVLEQLDETSLRHFTHAMSGLKRIDATQVRATIAEFLSDLAQDEEVVRGGLAQARGLLEQHVGEGLLLRILDDVDSPSAHNVWQKLAKVSDEALADFLTREHPQTTAVVVSKFGPEHAARILNRLDPEMARDVVIGLARVASLDPHVIEAIGDTMSRDFLATHSDADYKRNPADRVGAIMNYTSPSVRDHILDHIGIEQPEFAEEIRRKMFTVEDIPARVPRRAVAAVVRSIDQETLLKVLFTTRESAPEAGEFILDNLSTRMAEQLREELGEITSVRRKEGESAQAEIIRVIRELVARGEIELVEEDEV